MVTINQDGSPDPDSYLNHSSGRSPKKVILIAAFLILILAAAIIFLKDKLWPSVQPETGKQGQNIVIPKVFYNLAGLVKKMEANSFIFEASIPQLDASGNPIQKKEDRKVNVTPSTRFSRLTFVAQAGKAGKSPVETSITFKEIKEGDYIEVISNQDVSTAKEFEASQVRSLPQNF